MNADAVIAMTLLDIAVVIVLGWAAAGVARRAGQPPVIGEILVGIALGPSLLGLLPGDLTTLVFPTEVRPFLQLVAQLGLVLFMVGVGWDLEPSSLRGRSRPVVTTVVGSVAVPFGAGAGLAFLLVEQHPGTAPRTVFVLLLACATAMTAFPVLARIITDAGLTDQLVGRLALVAASINDLIAWIVLAAVLALAGAEGGGTGPWLLLAGMAGHVAVLVVVRRRLLPALFAWVGRGAQRESTALLVIAAGGLASAAVSGALGLHAVVGAFAFGVAVPKELAEQAAGSVRPTLERMGMVLLPVFFVVAGFGVDVVSLGGAELWELLAIIAVASSSKLVGAGLGARLGGLPTRPALAIGALMNARGLTELIVLQVGREAAVLDGAVFTMMTIMAIVTTVATGPLLRLIVRRDEARPAAEPAAPVAPAAEPAARGPSPGALAEGRPDGRG